MGLGLLLAGLGGCKEEAPPTRSLEGNRGAIRPGGGRTLKTGEPKPQSFTDKH
jgi:hypothetical protein